MAYNICFSLDNDYSEQLAVAITSIIKTCDDNDEFNFYILDGGISEFNKKRIINLKKFKDFKIEFIFINYDDFDSCPMLKDKDEHYSDYHTTKPTYFRFKLPSLFPKLDKILYLDCDIVVNGSLKELYETNVDEYYAAMVKDIDYKIEKKRLRLDQYYNAGVMLINLEKWYQDGIENKLFDFAKKNKDILLWQDQDVVNLLFNKKILEVSDKWNFQIAKGEFENEQKLLTLYGEKTILHFAGRYKPWLNLLNCPLFEIYYACLYEVPWVDNIHKYKSQWLDFKLRQNILDGSIKEEFDKSYKYVESIKQHAQNERDIITKNLNKAILTENKKIHTSLEKQKQLFLDENQKVYDGLEEQKELFLEENKKVHDSLEKHKQLLLDENKKVYDGLKEQKELFLEENKKIYDFIEIVKKDLLGISDIRFKKTDDCYFEEQSKIYEYINSQVENVVKKYDEKLVKQKTKLDMQEKKIKFLENELEKLGFINKKDK